MENNEASMKVLTPSIPSPLTPVTLIDGVDSVIIDAIQSSTKRERNLTFKLEDNIVKFMAATNRKKLVFPPLSSHHRLILHRLADRFNLAHIVSEDTNDAGKTNNKTMVLYKQDNISKNPDFLLIDKYGKKSKKTKKKIILKRKVVLRKKDIITNKKNDVDEGQRHDNNKNSNVENNDNLTVNNNKMNMDTKENIEDEIPSVETLNIANNNNNKEEDNNDNPDNTSDLIKNEDVEASTAKKTEEELKMEQKMLQYEEARKRIFGDESDSSPTTTTNNMLTQQHDEHSKEVANNDGKKK